VERVWRHELSDDGWESVKRLLPEQARTGRPRKDDRLVLNGMLWILRTGAPWRDLPDRYGSWSTVYGRFRSWRARGVLAGLAEGLLRTLQAHRRIDWDLWCVDGSSVRASPCAAGALKKGAPKTNPGTTRWVAHGVA